MRRYRSNLARSSLLPLIVGGAVFQGCTVLLPYPGPIVIDLTRGIPHFDGDGEDSFLDRLFGFDDDDD